MRVWMEPGPKLRPFQSHNPHSWFLFNPRLLLGSSFLKNQILWEANGTPCLCVFQLALLCWECEETWAVESPKGRQWLRSFLPMYAVPWPHFLSFLIRCSAMWYRQVPKETETHPMSSKQRGILSQGQAINKLFTVHTPSLMLQYLRNRGRI